MIEKRSVEKNFSKGAESYDDYAVVQRYMAEKLFEIIEKDGKCYENILEIGCGTGVFSEKLLQYFKKSYFEFIDISQEMILHAKTKIKESEKIKFICCDGESYKGDKKYDLIVSNAVFQWFQNIEESINSYFEMLNDGGAVLFSVFGDGTYIELKNSLKKAGISYEYIQPFVKRQEIERKAVELTGEFILIEEKYIEIYKNMREFLKYIKKIGANSAEKDKPVIAPGKIREAERIYIENYGEKEGVVVTNNLFFCMIKKEK